MSNKKVNRFTWTISPVFRTSEKKEEEEEERRRDRKGRRGRREGRMWRRKKGRGKRKIKRRRGGGNGRDKQKFSQAFLRSRVQCYSPLPPPSTSASICSVFSKALSVHLPGCHAVIISKVSLSLYYIILCYIISAYWWTFLTSAILTFQIDEIFPIWHIKS